MQLPDVVFGAGDYGVRYRYLNVSPSWIGKLILKCLTEAVYPFYILHQTVIVLIGCYVLIKTNLSVYDGFLVVSLSSLAVCVTLYLLLIRPFNLTRLLFGMKNFRPGSPPARR